MNLLTIKSAFPEYYYSQAECLEAMRGADFWNEISGSSRHLLEKVLKGNSGIDGRYFCLDNIDRAWQMDAQQLSEYYEQEAPKLAVKAVKKALNEAGVRADEVDALFLCSCTGYLCPGVSSYVAEQLGLRRDVFLQDSTGLGCGAAVPMLRSAKGYVTDDTDAVVVTVAVEVCSAAFFVENDVGVLISMCLFGDGASAAVWCGDGYLTAGVSGWSVGEFQSHHVPEEREKIRFTNAKGKLRNQLDRSVPALAGESVRLLYERRKGDPQKWVTHGGGRDVIEELEKVLGEFEVGRLEYAREVMRKGGNLSSPSVLYALELCLEEVQRDDEVDCVWVCSFGAGFSAHSCEVKRS